MKENLEENIKPNYYILCPLLNVYQHPPFLCWLQREELTPYTMVCYIHICFANMYHDIFGNTCMGVSCEKQANDLIGIVLHPTG